MARGGSNAKYQVYSQQGGESAHTQEQEDNMIACMQRVIEKQILDSMDQDDCPDCWKSDEANIDCPHCKGTFSLLLGDYELNPLQQQFIEWKLGKWGTRYPFMPTQQQQADYWWKFWFDCDQEYDCMGRI